MAYQALYRQWRPRFFSEIVGQEAIVETLQHQVQTGRIAHAYLFCGSRGTGKTSTAKILARAINCGNPRNGDACGECEICRQMLDESFMDILEYDAASNSRVEDARDLLEKASFPPQSGRYKVYIIDEVHMLSTSAFNALLKTLEEPPEYLVFILATTEPYKLPATILSRCQRFDFGRIPAVQIQHRLREAVQGSQAEATDGALMAIARAAEGGMRDALSILDMCLGYGKRVDEALVRLVLGTSDRSFLFRFSSALRDRNAGEVIRLVDELMSSGKDPLVFSRDLSAHLRTLILARCSDESLADILEISEEDADEYLREGKEIPLSRLMEMLDLFMHLETDLRYATSPRIALENVSLKCCLRTQETDSLALNDRIAELEAKISRLEEKIASAPTVREGESIPFRQPESVKGKSAGGTAPANGARAASEKKTGAGKELTPMGRSTDEIWKEAMKSLQKTEPGIHGMFLMGQYAGSDGTEYRWKANPSFDFIVASLNSAAKKAKIEEALSAAAGTPCTFLGVDANADLQKKEEASEEDYMNSLYQTFGTEPVQVVDKLPNS